MSAHNPHHSRHLSLTVIDPRSKEAITGTLKELSERFGVPYQTVYKRLFRMRWTVEQSLGLVAHVRQAHEVTRKLPPLPYIVRCGSVLANLLSAVAGEISGEEYLRREGVGSNAHPLPYRDSAV